MTSTRKMPTRGFPEAEYNHRLERAQEYLISQSLDALLLTTEVDIRYFTGFLTQFFQSPTRPWPAWLMRYRQPCHCFLPRQS